ncbi:MAG: TraB/GumN family protein, partial [Candidatus Omnitrophica bacterium]|nr:TraB/GumN family protein [Candidatus Omnitrophota bacterium]
KIDGFLKDDAIYFIVVGAAHLVGEKGIISILEKKGYSVIQL